MKQLEDALTVNNVTNWSPAVLAINTMVLVNKEVKTLRCNKK